jgi:hypothetical protein
MNHEDSVIPTGAWDRILDPRRDITLSSLQRTEAVHALREGNHPISTPTERKW